jgi:hypothetical protein
MLRAGVGLYKYGAMISSIQQASTDHSYESLSKTTVVQVTAGEHVYAACYLYDYSQLYSEARAQTKLTGFLYRFDTYYPNPKPYYIHSILTVSNVVITKHIRHQSKPRLVHGAHIKIKQYKYKHCTK